MSMTPKAAEAFVECFNENHLPGTPVVVIRDAGERTNTITRSEALVVMENLPVIFLEGISGYYDLTRVVVVPEVPDSTTE